MKFWVKRTDSALGFKFLRDDGASVLDEEVGLTNLALEVTDNMKGITNKNYSDRLNAAYETLADNPTGYAEYFDAIPVRYPAQLFEAICYFVIFAIMMWLFWRSSARKQTGFLTGVFFVTLFGARFFIEFLKERQAGVDEDITTALNMGQYLSIPLVLIGIYLIAKNFKNFTFSDRS